MLPLEPTNLERRPSGNSAHSFAVAPITSNGSIRRESLNTNFVPSAHSTSCSDKNDPSPSKYRQYSNSFAILVLAGTFVATYFVACMSLMTERHGLGVSGRIFGLMIFAAFLSVAAAILAGINAVLFTLLENEDSEKAPLLRGIPQMVYNPTISFAVCVITLTAALYSYIFGVFFYLVKYNPQLKTPFLILIAISLCSGLCPTFSLFVATSRYVGRSILR